MPNKPIRAIIITYYWPPAGGAGVQRWLKFTKYLREFGVEPIIYTPEDPDYPAYDESQVHEIPEGIEIVKRPIWEPYVLYRKLTGRSKDAKIYSGFIQSGKRPGLAQRLSVFIRGNFFIPDARKFWIKPSVRFLRKYLRSNPVDVIISTGPPHTTHMIALGVKRSLNLPWIADFRDPWTNIDFYDQLGLTRYADRQHRSKEQQVLRNADRVVTVSPSWVRDFEDLGREHVDLITNGFDPRDFDGRTEEISSSLTHIGSINPDRNPALLWQALEEILADGKGLPDDFKLRLIGPIDNGVREAIEGMPNLAAKFEHVPWMDHGEVVHEMQGSSVLLLLVNKTPNALGILPGKLFEYMGSGRPILSVGPPRGDVMEIIGQSGCGVCVDLNDKEAIKQGVIQLFDSDDTDQANSDYIRRFSRRELAGRFAELIKEELGKQNNPN